MKSKDGREFITLEDLEAWEATCRRLRVGSVKGDLWMLGIFLGIIGIIVVLPYIGSLPDPWKAVALVTGLFILTFGTVAVEAPGGD